MSQLEALRTRIEALSSVEAARIIAEQRARRATKHEFFDLAFKDRQFRFDVEAINAQIDADRNSYSLAALELDAAMAEGIFLDREIQFERVVSLAFSGDMGLIRRPLTAILYKGDHAIIDGCHRIALHCLLGSQSAPTHLVPETVWNRYLMPLDGGGIYAPWEAR